MESRRERAGDDRVAREKTRKGVWVGGLPDDAGVGAGEAVDAHERIRRTDHAGSRGRRADNARGGRDVHAGRRPVRGGDAGDAAERARGAVNARAEERHGAKRSPGEGRALRAIALARKADDAGLCGCGTVNAGDKPRDIDHLGLAVHAVSVAETRHVHGEARVPVAGEKGVEAGEGNSMGKEKVVNGRHRLLLLLKARMSPAIIRPPPCQRDDAIAIAHSAMGCCGEVGAQTEYQSNDPLSRIEQFILHLQRLFRCDAARLSQIGSSRPRPLGRSRREMPSVGLREDQYPGTQ
jgi:hypothetical protein